MPTKRSPRKGSLAYWPRVHAKRGHPRISNYQALSETKLNGFAAYKVGMTHVFINDNRKNSITKGKQVAFPVTVLECPPLKVASIRAYKESYDGKKMTEEVCISKDKFLAKKVKLPKNAKKVEDLEKILDGCCEIRVNVYTQPHLTGMGKKKPEIFEIAIGGKDVKEKLEYAKSILGKEIPVSDVFAEGQQLDVFSVSRGKGTQGPVKRFKIGLRSHKSEKGRRGPANIGPWSGNRSWTVPHAGRMGYHNRVDKNKWLLKIGEKQDDINVKGGFLRYGLVKSKYLILKGSLPGAKKRLVRLMESRVANHRLPTQPPEISYISLTSQQRR